MVTTPDMQVAFDTYLLAVREVLKLADEEGISHPMVALSVGLLQKAVPDFEAYSRTLAPEVDPRILTAPVFALARLLSQRIGQA